MRETVRRSVLWQLYGGLTATVAIFAFLGELLWWSLYLSDRTNVTPRWTWIAHAGAAIGLVALAVYYSQRRRIRADIDRAGGAAMLEDRGLDIRIGPFQLRMQWAYLIAVILISSQFGSVGRAAILILLITAALLVHELGHATIALRQGHRDITIVLHLLGGTTFFDDRPSSRAERIAIAFAGPAVGLGLGLVILGLGSSFSSIWNHELYREALFVTAGWSLINLLPIHPLDGAAILETFVGPAAVVGTSIATAAAGCAVAAWMRLNPGVLLFFVVLLIVNIVTLPTVSRRLHF